MNGSDIPRCVHGAPMWACKEHQTHTAADPLTVEEASWQIAAIASDSGGAPAMLGIAMLSVAFALGVLVGWWLG